MRAVVVTGEGSAFCSGGNTGWIASEPDATVDHLRTRMIAFYRAWLSIRRLEVPTIAAVNGAAIGAGLCLALACDIRYAAAGRQAGRAVRAARHARRAWPAPTCCPNVVGEAHARDLLLTGRIVEADEALRLGLVSRVIDAGRRSATRCCATAAEIAATAPIASRLTKLALADGGHARLRDLPAVGGAGPADHAGHRGPAGGHPGRREKRAPVFAGRLTLGQMKRPPVRLTTLAFPLRTSVDGPGASSGEQR